MRAGAPTKVAYRSALSAALVLLALLWLTGCSGSQSALAPGGPYAQKIAELFWVFVAVCAVIWVVVMICLAVALVRPSETRSDPLVIFPLREERAGRIIAACASATALVLIGFTLLSFFAQRSLWAEEPDAIKIRTTGHQWWWQVEYQDSEPARTFLSANEIHIPLDRAVTVQLETRDVIHSFWAPTLAGKMDQISGHENEMRLIASRPGVYRGQCAEFCGQQHALMALLIVASPAQEFEQWREMQRQPARAPVSAREALGRQLFFARGCMLCHTIRGTPAGGKVGPDLTHLASRRTIAAGTAPLTSGHLAAWISDPQHVKPGNKMPNPELAGTDLVPLVSYLMTLQ